MSETVTILIGNSDDKLSQAEWHMFCQSLRNVGDSVGGTHFLGFSPSDAPWQNACLVVEVNSEALIVDLRDALWILARAYSQDSIALIVGKTEFIRPGGPS